MSVGIQAVVEGPDLRDPESEIERIVEAVRGQTARVLGRRGLVVAMSGGVDSSVCAALAVRAVGPGRVLGLFLPERDSEPESLTLAESWARTLGIDHLTEDITPALDAVGCYQRRDEAIRRLVPEYGEGWRSMIALPADRLDTDLLNVFHLTLQPPGGSQRTLRLPAREYREILAATNFKQRVRKMMEYHHADRLHYAVVGTPNRLEFDQGFFVKGGDGLADIKPIAHLWKTGVYQLAEALGVPTAVIERPPTTDTWSLPQTQEQFYFPLPARTMDRVLVAHQRGLSAQEAADEIDLDGERVARVYRDIERKRATTRYLHTPPLLVEPMRGGCAPDGEAG